jgi:hypothetical protein
MSYRNLLRKGTYFFYKKRKLFLLKYTSVTKSTAPIKRTRHFHEKDVPAHAQNHIIA